ncbi:hypothetical protein [Pusillimonas sp. ANT_WB101]|uniref:hypothetical protein n=1 Tax=Pusillimonas sp. ANT_WB101 TaxID=2597356 RepID=UPI0011EEB812|nr:hypothetical protein [Pusillimonas sp. ANT_WB101]KAA0910698.1 hypothetical protein FQ179_02135 [Pusillimonas sp. ANT_WB101]
MQPPLTRDDLIAIRDGNRRNEDIRTLLREIKRMHNAMLEIEHLRDAIDKAWKAETDSTLSALHRLRLLMADETRRL